MPRCGIIILVYLLYLARRVASDRDHFERPAANTDIVRSHAFCEFPSNMVNPQMLILCSWFYQIYALLAAWSLLQSGGCTRTAACSLILCTLQMIPGIPIHQVGCTRDMVRGRSVCGTVWAAWSTVNILAQCWAKRIPTPPPVALPGSDPVPVRLLITRRPFVLLLCRPWKTARYHTGYGVRGPQPIPDRFRVTVSREATKRKPNLSTTGSMLKTSFHSLI